MSFQGFSDETIQFLLDLSFNNHKTWFHENKKSYETFLKEPMQLLCQELAEAVSQLDENIQFTGAISRMNRDIRFSKDKSPYRDRMWLTLKIGGLKEANHPEIFFELSPQTYIYGMGFFHCPGPLLERYRKAIAANPHDFKNRMQSALSAGFAASGEVYKRKYKNDLPEEFQDWFHKKELYVSCQKPLDESVYSRKLLENLTAAIQTAWPMYLFYKKIGD